MQCKIKISKLTVALLFLVLITAVSIYSDTGSNNISANSIFNPQHILEIKITMSEKDWDLMRKERHDVIAALGPDRIEKPEPDPYNIYKAEVEIDGIKYSPVGIKKRGFLGSTSLRKPSLGIRFNEYDKQLKFGGLKRLSLNNNQQDPSFVHQFLTYKIFRDAGIPAPLCNFAKVYVNGKCLGIYSNVEAITDEFLKKHFGDDSGNLYEGQLSDFRPVWVDTFEKKNNKSKGKEDLLLLTKAFELDDDHLIEQLNELIDFDEYLTFWAMEVLTGHWDSYSNNGNNFFVYNNPAKKKFAFIPWGADSTFGDVDPYSPSNKPLTVMATSILPWRLYKIEKTREQYRERLKKLLDTVWNENALSNTVEQLETMLKPHIESDHNNFNSALSQVKNFIQNRRSALKKELDAPAPEWNSPLRQSNVLQKIGAFSADFDTYWRGLSYNNSDTRVKANFRMFLDGKRQWFIGSGVSAGPVKEPRFNNFPSIAFFGIEIRTGKWMIPVFIIDPELIESDKPIKIDNTAVFGAVLEGKILEFNIKSLNLMSGTIFLNKIGTNVNDRISGKIQADIYKFLR